MPSLLCFGDLSLRGLETAGVHNAFVEFLLESDRLTPAGASVLEQRIKHALAPMGMIAMAHEMLTSHAVEEILIRQDETREPFGEAAVRLSYLTPTQVEQILDIQRFRRHATVVEVLVLTGLMRIEEATDAFAEFLRREPHGQVLFDDTFALER